MKNILILIAMVFIVSISLAQKNYDTLQVQTSAICETCKTKIEKDMSFEKGVKSTSLNLDSKVLTVIYDASKTDSQKIRVAITKTGYDADSLKADSKAYKHLPDCCKNPETHSK